MPLSLHNATGEDSGPTAVPPARDDGSDSLSFLRYHTSPHHFIELAFRTAPDSPPGVCHIRCADTIEPLLPDELPPAMTLPPGHGSVRIVAGKSAGPPLDTFVVLDILIEANRSISIPTPPSHGTALYILEGAIQVSTSGWETFQNEGHGLVFAQCYQSIAVRSHSLAHARVVVAFAPSDQRHE